MVEGAGFEPAKAEPSDLQSDPFGRSGTPPKNVSRRRNPNWSWREESNPRPADYKSAALPTELRQHVSVLQFRRRILRKLFSLCKHFTGGIGNFYAVFI